jgi:hypothetical protein
MNRKDQRGEAIPVPEPVLKEDAIIGEANLGERPSSNQEEIGTH